MCVFLNVNHISKKQFNWVVPSVNHISKKQFGSCKQHPYNNSKKCVGVIVQYPWLHFSVSAHQEMVKPVHTNAYIYILSLPTNHLCIKSQ